MSRKQDPTYLVKQPHGYCFRINVPADLRRIVSLREIRYSLRTKDYLYAKSTALFLGLQVRRFFSELRARSEYLSQLSPQDLKRLIKEFVSKELDRAETKRLLCNNISPTQLRDIQYEHYTLSYLSWKAFTHRNYDTVANTAQSLLKDHGLDISQDSVDFKKLCRELLRATGFVAGVNANRESGVYDNTREHDQDFYDKYLAEPVKVSPTVIEDDSPLLSESIALFIKERCKAKNWSDKYRTEVVNALGLFQEFLIKDIPTSQIDSKKAVDFKYALIKLPPNRQKVRKYRDKTVQELLKMDIPVPMEEGNADRLLTRLSTYFKWAKAHGHIRDNYAAGIKFGSKTRDDEKVQIFTKDDLDRIFNSKEYKENSFKHPYQFFAPYFALYTGMRVDEIGQLHLDDFYQVDDIWAVSINDNGPNKKLKTNTNAKRDIPLHPIFKELDLQGYVQQLKDKGEVRLFPEINKGVKGYGETISRAFNGNWNRIGYLQRWGVKGPHDKRKKVFNSFRHTFIDHLKQKQVPLFMLQQIAGHKSGSETIDRYGKPYGTKALFYNVISYIDFSF